MRLSPATDTELPLCFIVIVRNLWHLNNLPSFPTRFCTNSTGPPGILILTRMATTSSTGHRISSPSNEITLSNIHFSIIIVRYFLT